MRYIKWSVEKVEEVQRRLGRGQSLQSIADDLNISKQSLYATLRNYGVKSQKAEKRIATIEKIKNLTDIQIAYFAGLFEGEGTMQKNKIMIMMSIKNQDILDKVYNCIGGNLYFPRKQVTDQKYCQWVLAHKEAVLLLISLIKPYLGQHRLEQIKKYVDLSDVPVV